MSETNVTTTIMSAVSGSIRNPTSSGMPPETPQVYTRPLKLFPASTSGRTTKADSANAVATPRIVTLCAPMRPIFQPSRPASIAPARQDSGIAR